ncbi:TPR domain protein [Sulfurifustis variabilis]|uniref:TPR domain protein n=1 Tax=Sulfurifustis variabilis TaxID=1675686 RepID=A0A1B4V3R6_9GAMM|nr:tetratricopeptide repeat protein [Sulfurifustis variabilis]BAU48025.1 TPR domain protein [Sulfurifustis variabilis]
MPLRPLLGRTVLLVLVLALVACGGAEARKAKYFERGKVYFDQENYDKAVIELKNVLQIDPKDAATYLLLAKVEEKRNNHRQAFSAYAKAVELAPDNPHAQARLGRYYLRAGDLTKAQEMADAILNMYPSHVEGRVLKAAITMLQGNEDKALTEATAVVNEHPEAVDAAELLSAMYQKSGNFQRAIATLAQAIEKNPRDVGMRLQLARLYASQKQPEMAERALREVIELEPKNFNHRVTLAAFFAQADRVEQAEKVLREAIQTDPEDMQRRLALVELIANRKGLEYAESELEEALKSDRTNASLRFALGRIYEKRDASGKAVELYRQLIAEHGVKPEGLQARNLLAHLLYSQGKFAEAATLTAEVLKENPRDNAGLLLRGKLALQEGDSLTAISSFRSVLKDQPESSDALGLLGEAHALNRESELAREHFQKAVEANPRNVAARVRFARFLAETGDSATALKEVERALASASDDIAALRLKAELHVTRKEFAAADAAVVKLKSAHAKNPTVYLLAGQLYAGQKKYDAALKEFELAFALSPASPDVLAGIVKVELARGRPEAAVSRLKDVLKNTPDHALAHHMLGEVYLGQKKFVAAEQSIERARELQPKWNLPYRTLANAHAVRGDNEQAIKILEQGLQNVPEDTVLSLALAEAQERAGRHTQAIDAYERVLRHSPNNLVAANNLAALLADHRNDAGGLKRARELVPMLEQAPQPVLRDTAAWVYYRAGEIDKAISLLKPVVEKAPKVAIFQYHLGMAYHKQGDAQAAKLHLSKAVEANAKFPGADEARATLSAIP